MIYAKMHIFTNVGIIKPLDIASMFLRRHQAWLDVDLAVLVLMADSLSSVL